MKQYKNKKTGQIGKVVHYKGITTTLQFDDGTEKILSPANLKRYWTEVEESGEPDKITWEEFCKIMREHNKEYGDKKRTLSGVVVYSQDNFETQYSENDRSYRIWNNCKLFSKSGRGKTYVGDCLDGEDLEVDLNEYNWKVDYCYMEKSAMCA